MTMLVCRSRRDGNRRPACSQKRASRRSKDGRLALATLQERAPPLLVQPSRSAQGHAPVNDDDKKDDDKKKVPPPTLSGAPERDLEEKLKKHPHDADAKADVGSDESMDASDPPSSSTPGSTREPAPSSGFPE
jgi:hypothetical protein